MNIDFTVLVFFVLSTIGMTHIIVDGSILEWFRDFVKKVSALLKVPSFGKVVDCYLCAGTWCGFAMGLILVSSNPFVVFACGCAGGFLANFAAVMLNWLEAMTIVNLPSENNEQ